jgi:hypothetical protein
MLPIMPQERQCVEEVEHDSQLLSHKPHADELLAYCPKGQEVPQLVPP